MSSQPRRRTGVQDTPSSRLLALFDGQRLTPTQRRIAQCLVEHAAEAPFLSSIELAALANVSQPSVTRFAMGLGYRGYPELRLRLREIGLGARPESVDEARRNEWQQAVVAEAENLHILAGALADPTPVREAGALLAASRPLVVLGLRVSAPVAHYFGYFAVKVHPDVRVLTEGGSALGDRLEQARAAGAEALLAFVLPRYPRETVDAMNAARKLGYTVVAVTDRALGAADEASDLVLHAPVGSRLVFDSQAAPMMQALVLLQAMCDAMPAQTQERLEAFERWVQERQVFVP